MVLGQDQSLCPFPRFLSDGTGFVQFHVNKRWYHFLIQSVGIGMKHKNVFLFSGVLWTVALQRFILYLTYYTFDPFVWIKCKVGYLVL